MSRHKTLSPFRHQVFTYIRRVPASSSRGLIRLTTSRKHVVMSRVFGGSSWRGLYCLILVNAGRQAGLGLEIEIKGRVPFGQVPAH